MAIAHEFLKKTESVCLHLSGRKTFPPILKGLSTGPTINEHNYDGQLQLLLLLPQHCILLILLLHCLLLLLLLLPQFVNYLLLILLLLP